MKKIFITNEYTTSKANGIGTFIQELIFCFNELEININVLLFNSNKTDFCIEEFDGICLYHFPVFPDQLLQDNFCIIDKFLQLYIQDSSDNVFIINYSPSSKLMQELKHSHPLSKQIYIIHDMFWCSYLLGDVKTYIEILNKYKNNLVEKDSDILISSYKEEIQMCKLANHIVCLSDDTFQLLSEHYSIRIDKLSLIPNGISRLPILWSLPEKKQFLSNLYFNNDEKILLYVGRMNEQKGFVVCIEAFKEVLQKYPSCRLVLVGAISDWCYVYKYSYPVISKIIFTGSLSPGELAKWYQVADIGIIPSYTEQCSYVGLEMMSYKLPIVASDGFGVRNMFHEGINARIANIGTRNGIKEFKTNLVYSILDLLYSETTCNNLSRVARELCSKTYSISNMKAKYKELLGIKVNI